MSRVRAVPVGFAARAPRVRERGGRRPGFRGDKGAQRESFENTRDLVGDLLGAKNAGVTLMFQKWKVFYFALD
jgi:hypothetical protein